MIMSAKGYTPLERLEVLPSSEHLLRLDEEVTELLLEDRCNLWDL